MKPPSRIVILLAITFAICFSNLVLVWRTVEQELEGIKQVQHHAHDPTNQQLQRKLPPPLSHHNSTTLIDPEVYRILQDAGVSHIAPEVIKQLPRWSDIVAQYGPKPIINLESCSAYRSSIPQKDRIVAVAGLFNTGTNLLASLMTQNCQIAGSKGTGMRMQVPWGKHNPPTTHRLKHVAQIGGKNVTQTDVFPLVILKDPYHWAVSQCRHRYFTNWAHAPEHCPNLVDWRSGAPATAHVLYALGNVGYPSLLDVWSTWYGEYAAQASRFPLAFLRFEDILFHAEEVVTKLCDCVGGRRPRRHEGKFQYPKESVKEGLKGHRGGGSGLIDAMIRYGDPELRLEGWSEQDWDYAGEHLDWGLMDRYGYTRPGSKWNS